MAVGSERLIARAPSRASADVTGLQPGAYSASTAWASALKALGPVTCGGRPTVRAGSYTTTFGSTSGDFPVCLCSESVSP